MKVTVDVKDKAEKSAVIAAMADPVTRAFVLITGTLLQLPSDRARRSVLSFVTDHADEQKNQSVTVTETDDGK